MVQLDGESPRPSVSRNCLFSDKHTTGCKCRDYAVRLLLGVSQKSLPTKTNKKWMS